jgi:digeranylgeranylglycerophospholipid reductase
LYDAVIIGGGPVGSRLAQRLAGLGYGVAVIEQKERPGRRVCCTGIVGKECLESFAVPEELVLRRLSSARLISPSGKVLRLWREEDQAYVLDRAGFDVALAQRARDTGAEYLFNSRADKLAVASHQVSIEVVRDGDRQGCKARAVVIASGFNSRLVETLGLGNISYYVRGAQAEVAAPALEEMELYFGEEVAPGFFAWLVPALPATARVGLLTHQSPGPYLKKLLAYLSAQGKIASTEAEVSYGRVPLKPLSRTYHDRLLIAGTAAGQVKPTTGGGIYYGLMCADIAAETLHQALKANDLSAGRLAGYQRRWQQRLGQELKKGYRVRRLYQELNDRQIDSLFETVKTKGLVDSLLGDSDVSFDWHSGGLLRILGDVVLSRFARALRRPFRPRDYPEGSGD